MREGDKFRASIHVSMWQYFVFARGNVWVHAPQVQLTAKVMSRFAQRICEIIVEYLSLMYCSISIFIISDK